MQREAHEKHQEVLRRWCHGERIEAIAASVGYSRTGAYKAIKYALDEERAARVTKTRAGIARRRALQDARLHEAIAVVFQILSSADSSDSTKLAAIEKLVGISAREAKLHGLDAPTSTTTTMSGPDGGPVEVNATSDHDALINLLARLATAGAESPGNPSPDGSGG